MTGLMGFQGECAPALSQCQCEYASSMSCRWEAMGAMVEAGTGNKERELMLQEVLDSSSSWGFL